MMTTMFSDSYGRNSFCEFVFHEYSVLTCSSLHKQDSTPIPTPPLILVVHTVSTCPHAVCLVTCTHTHTVWTAKGSEVQEMPDSQTCNILHSSCDCYHETFESDTNKKPILPTTLLEMHTNISG